MERKIEENSDIKIICVHSIEPEIFAKSDSIKTKTKKSNNFH